MERIAVIDLGSNSFHMIICEVSEKYFNHIKIANDNDYKAYVRLGANLKKGEFIKEEKINEILTVLTRFHRVAQQHNVNKIFCMATEALRRAGNGKQIIDLIQEQIGIHVELISGNQEAYLGYYAIVNSFSQDNYLMVDIGGSSTELVYVKNRKLKHSISLPVGSLNICDLFDSTNQINDALYGEMINSFTKRLKEVEWLKDVQIDTVIGVGGTMRTIGKYERAKKRYSLSIPHNFSLSMNHVQDIFSQLRMLTVEERLNTPELPAKRAIIFPSALILVLAIMNYVQSKQVIISKYGLREGVVFDYLLKGEICEDVFDRDVEKFLYEQNISESLYRHYVDRAISRCKLVMLNGQSFSIDKNLIQLSTLFFLKKQESDGKKIKKFLKYLFTRGIYGLSHQQVLISLLIAGIPFEENYKSILTEDDLEMASQIKQLDLFGV